MRKNRGKIYSVQWVQKFEFLFLFSIHSKLSEKKTPIKTELLLKFSKK